MSKHSKAPKEKKVPVRVRRLCADMSGGQRLVLTLRQSDVGDGRSYCLERTGKPVGGWTVERALSEGLIIPASDGLFPDIESQTYRLAL